MTPVILDNWSTTSGPGEDEYTAPECRTLRLQGVNRNGQHAGMMSHTSPIVKAEGRRITTRSGSVYILGSIDPGFHNWLKKNRPEWDYRNPITLKRIE